MFTYHNIKYQKIQFIIDSTTHPLIKKKYFCFLSCILKYIIRNYIAKILNVISPMRMIKKQRERIVWNISDRATVNYAWKIGIFNQVRTNIQMVN